MYTNRDRRQTAEYDFVPDPSRGRNREHKRGDPHEDAADKYVRTREKSRSVRKPPSFPRRTNLIQIKRRCADSSSLANARREMVVNSDIARKRNESLWLLDSQVPVLIQSQKHIVCRQFSERFV